MNPPAQTFKVLINSVQAQMWKGNSNDSSEVTIYPLNAKDDIGKGPGVGMRIPESWINVTINEPKTEASGT